MSLWPSLIFLAGCALSFILGAFVGMRSERKLIIDLTSENLNNEQRQMFLWLLQKAHHSMVKKLEKDA